MKKQLAIVLMAAMTCALTLTGCGSKNSVETENIKLAGYKGIEVPAIEDVAEITDEDVMAEINALLSQSTTSEEITDRPVQVGDTVNIDFVGTMDGEEFDGGSAQGYSLEIGSGTFIPGFEDSVIGHEIGDTFDWNGQFPENYTEELAGKDVTFTITVNGISVYTVPELNDEFVQTVSTTSKTVDAYKKEVKETLEKNAQATYEYNLEDAVCEAIVEKVEVIAYPEGVVEETAEMFRSQYVSYAEAYGISYEEFIEAQGYEVEAFEAEIQVAAEKRVKLELAMAAIADAERLEPSAKEYEEAYAEMAEMYGYEDVDSLIGAAGGEEALKKIVRQEVVLDWLAKHCVQVVE